ncbi:hypothetical protein EKH55_4508 [Sinorhizobium alkalisoli]|nr:hypothetical protein EKH55_4508 [Sinorhizobium alkalisoli]
MASGRRVGKRADRVIRPAGVVPVYRGKASPQRRNPRSHVFDLLAYIDRNGY